MALRYALISDKEDEVSRIQRTIRDHFRIGIDTFSDIPNLHINLNDYEILICDVCKLREVQSRFLGSYLIILDPSEDLPELEYVQSNSMYILQRPLKDNILKQTFQAIGNYFHVQSRAKQITKLHRQLRQENLDALLLCNSEGTIYYVNSQFGRMLGRSKNDVLGLKIQSLFGTKEGLNFAKNKRHLQENGPRLKGELSFEALSKKGQYWEYSFFRLNEVEENYGFIFHNSSRIRIVEGLLRKRLSFESLVVDITKNFLASEDVDLSFNYALIELGRFCGAETIELWYMNDMTWESFVPKLFPSGTSDAPRISKRELAQLFEDAVEQKAGETEVQAIPYYAVSLGLDSAFPAYLIFFRLEERGFFDDPLFVNLIKEIFHHAFSRKNFSLERTDLMKVLSDQLVKLQTIMSVVELFRDPSELYLEQIKAALELLKDVFLPRDIGIHIHIDDWSWTKEQSTLVLDTFHYLFSGKVSGPGKLEITANFKFIDQDHGFLVLLAQEIDRYINQNRLKRELDLMEIQFLHSQKVGAIGQLAAGIAHEINTPTQYIRDNIIFLKQVLNQSIPLFKRIRTIVYRMRNNEQVSGKELQRFNEDLQKIEPRYLVREIPKAIHQSLEGLSQVNHIITSMRIYSHGSMGKKSLAQLNDIVTSAITVCRTRWKIHADLETRLSPSLPEIKCIAGELSQVFVNIILNSTDAVESFNRTNDRPRGLIQISTLTYENWAEVRIKDNGTGISMNDRDHIFDLFYSTKRPGKGTGQGLAIAQEIVKNHHDGEIFFFSLPNHGAEFRIRLPIKTKPLKTKPIEAK